MNFEFAGQFDEGPDVSVKGGAMPWDQGVYPNSTWREGNVFGDFKPNTESGNERFDEEVASGKLPANTQMLPYDPNMLTLDSGINPR